MDEIDVEPVERVDGATSVDAEADANLPQGVDAPDYVLYGGKGGVGKTTMAAATGLSSAAGGVRTLVVSTDPAHSLSDTFEVDVPAEPARIREDIPLFAAEIDPDAAMEDGLFGGDGDPLGGMGEMGDAMGGLGGMGGMAEDAAEGMADAPAPFSAGRCPVPTRRPRCASCSSISTTHGSTASSSTPRRPDTPSVSSSCRRSGTR